MGALLMTYAPAPVGLATFAANQWDADDDAAVTGDVAKVTISEIPTQTGYELHNYECLINGSEIVELALGPDPSFTRRLALNAGQNNTIQIRAKWRPIMDNPENEANLEDGDWSVAKNVFPSVGVPRATIIADRTSCAVHGGIRFEVVTEGFGLLDEFGMVETRWTFDDVGNWKNMPSDFIWGLDRNVAFGPMTAHAWKTAGMKTVSVECRVFGVQAATASIDINVQDGNVLWPGTDTICVSSAGNFDGAPAGARQVNSIGEAFSYYNSMSSYRLLFRRGESWVRNFDFDIRGKNHVQYGVFGPEQDGDVVLDGRGFVVEEHTGDCEIFGFDCRAGYDASNGFSITERPPNLLTTWGDDDLGNPLLGVVTYSDMKLSGGDKLSFFVGLPPRVHFFDVSATDWLDYMIFAQVSVDILCRGCAFKQNVDAVNGAGKSEQSAPFYVDHNPFRLSKPQGTTLLSACDFFSNVGHSNNTTHQPPIRWPFQDLLKIANLIIDRVRTEGDSVFLGGNSNSAAPGIPPFYYHGPQRIIVDRLHHVTTSTPSLIFGIQGGPSVMRNFVGVIGNRDGEFPGSTDQYFFFGAPVQTKWRAKQQTIRAYSFTVVDLRNSVRAPNPVDIYNEPSDPERRMLDGLENYVIYDANVSSPQGQSGAVDLTPLFTSSYRGNRTEADPAALDTSTANVGTGVVPYPLPGHSALGAATTGRVSAWDFMGRLRPGNPGVAGTPAHGALEAA